MFPTHQTTMLTPPRSRRAFVGFLAGATGVLVAACSGLPTDPKAASPSAALPPPAGPPSTQPPSTPTAPPPTATLVPPTATPPPPTATPVPPTVTPLPPTATPLPPTATPQPSPTPFVYEPARLTAKLGSAQTSYAGSIPERAWNVELAVKRLNGTTVAPGEIFSFNDAVGPTTLSAGFRIGYGITLSNDRPQTVPSVGGGICQVATTVFQAAFWAGLPFVERHYHLYWISRYGQAPSGKTGYDATVDDPGVDLKFKNTTDDWIRLESWFDGENLGFAILGVDPGWKVEALDPKIFGVVRTSQATVRQEDWSLPPGRELWVEHAEDGFSVTATRLVKIGEDIVDEYTFTNRYLPSRNVLLVGAVPRPRVQAQAQPPAPTEPTAPADVQPMPAEAPPPAINPAPAPVQPPPIQAAPAPAPALPAPSLPKLVPSKNPVLRPIGKP